MNIPTLSLVKMIIFLLPLLSSNIQYVLMLMTQSLTITNEVCDHPSSAHPSHITQAKKAPSGPVSHHSHQSKNTARPQPLCFLPHYKSGCTAVIEMPLASHLASIFFTEWSCFHFVTLPMITDGLPNKLTMGKHFLLVKLFTSPTLIIVFSLLQLLMVTNTHSPLLLWLGDQNNSP